nr:hypothetical protein StreXyl84_15120 [Streptomyces sp. Xyl84]
MTRLLRKDRREREGGERTREERADQVRAEDDPEEKATSGTGEKEASGTEENAPGVEKKEASGTEERTASGAEGNASGTGGNAPGTGEGHARGTGEGHAPGTDEGDASGAGGPDEDGAPARRSRHRTLRRAALAASALVLVLAGGGFFYGAHQLRSAPSARNTALTDDEATTRVAGDVGNDLARVFSYTPDGLDATERSARSVLTGKAARQYTALVGRIRADVARERVTLSTQAVRVGVVQLHGDEAELLVLLDQVSRRGKGKASAAAAQLAVTARREGDQWRIVDLQSR